MRDELRILCAHIPKNELVAAECQNLTGGCPDAEGLAICQTLDYFDRGAYLTKALRCLAEASTLAELTAQVGELHLNAERFRIEYLRVSQLQPRRTSEVVLAIADAIPASPDLDDPLNRFAVVGLEHKLFFAEILAETQHNYRRHNAKPYRTSSSLPTRLARALVNLVSPPAKTILDPFCGTGSILLEAQSLGLEVFGRDINATMVNMTRGNLAHFGYRGQVELGDALECSTTADALVTDLPYGRMLQTDEKALAAILRHNLQLAPQAVYLSDENISGWLEQAGYQQIEVFSVWKRHGMSRYVHRAQAR